MQRVEISGLAAGAPRADFRVPSQKKVGKENRSYGGHNNLAPIFPAKHEEIQAEDVTRFALPVEPHRAVVSNRGHPSSRRIDEIKLLWFLE